MWHIRHSVDDDARGEIIVEDDEGKTVLVIPWGGPNHALGRTSAEHLARWIRQRTGYHLPPRTPKKQHIQQAQQPKE